MELDLIRGLDQHPSCRETDFSLGPAERFFTCMVYKTMRRVADCICKYVVAH